MPNIRSAMVFSRLPILVGTLGMATLLGGCDNEDTSAFINLNTNTLSPAQALTYGRQSAVYQHLSHHWQLESINASPTSYNFFLDLTTLSTGHAIATAGVTCAPIEVLFDTTDIDQNRISVKDIQRKLDDCSSEHEDRLMAILADSKSIARHPNDPNKLILTSSQDTLVFTLYLKK